MKRTFLMVALATLLTGSAMAQGQRMTAEQRAERRAEKLNLTGEKKTTFVATYTQYTNELRELRTANRPQQGQKMTDEQRKAMHQKMADVQTKYKAEFAKSLTEEQVNELFRAPQGRGQRPQRGQKMRQGAQQGCCQCQCDTTKCQRPQGPMHKGKGKKGKKK